MSYTYYSNLNYISYIPIGKMHNQKYCHLFGIVSFFIRVHRLIILVYIIHITF